MTFFKNLFVFCLIFTLLLGCESKKSYNINADKMISDLSARIKVLDEDLATLDAELKEVKAVLDDREIDSEVRSSIKKEIHEGELYYKEIDQWISYLKVQRKQRYQSLVARKGSETLKEEAEREVKAYFMQKELKPIATPWKKRYRTAIEL